MAAVVAARPVPPSLDSPVSASSQFEVHQYYPFHKLSQKPTGVRSHYRPHSTILLDPSPVVSHRNSVLVKPRRQSTIHRSSSLGATMGLGIRKNSDKEKDKTKEKAKELPKLRIQKLSDNFAPASPPASSPTLSTKGVSRPRTSSGETASERSTGSGKPALPRVRPQRSMVSLFSATSDVSLNMVSSEEPITRSKSVAPPSSFRSTSRMDIDKLPPTPTTSTRSKRSSRGENDHELISARKKKDPESFWLTRSKTKLHPFPGEAPYMVSYDTPSLDGDRYSDLLLQRLNPGSPSFYDFGKKPPLTVLDLGCGQGHWVLWAASVWRTSRITGFDLVDITLPAFQTTENVNFIRGNFLFKLPFPAKSFEYVRLANLSLCVPYNMWPSLFSEVKRILTNNGRMEFIDDQICFPYGEEPKTKDDPMPERRRSSGINGSFFNFDDEFNTDSEDDDTLEDMTSASSSTTSTLVNEWDPSKFPSSKRSSTQSNRSSLRSNPVISVVESQPFISNRDKPLPIPTEEASSLMPVDDHAHAISPSPTITQDNINALNDETSLATSETITQEFPTKERKRHRKTGSSSSTNSVKEAIGTWKEKRDLSLDMEHIFEFLLINKSGIHPRPSEFVQDLLLQTFGKGNAGKIRSYHIKLAPYDSPIGPGGTLGPKLPTIEPVTWVEKELKPPPIPSYPSFWKQSKDKAKRPRTSSGVTDIDRKRADSNASETSTTNFDLPHPVVSAAAAKRLGIKPTVPPLPSKRHSDELTSIMEGESPSRSYNTLFSTSSSKVAETFGFSQASPPKSIAFSRSSDASTGRPTPQRSTTTPSLKMLGLPVSAMGRSISTGSSGSPIYTPTTEQSRSRSNLSSSAISRDHSSGSSQHTTSSESSPSSDGSIPADIPHMSAKAANRLGISFSVLTTASAVHSRDKGVMAPAQSPGILVWPTNYIPMSPTEVEMHSCKYLQTLLGCRHALHEYITSVEVDGQKLATDQDFEDTIWEYECFRRSRFHWPIGGDELFNEQGVPEPPSPADIQKGNAVGSTDKKGHSRNSSDDSAKQFRRDELTHIRTIRVFDACKMDDKTFTNLMFPNSQSPRKSSRAS